MTVKISKDPSGLTIISEMLPHVEGLSIGVYIKSGSRDETQEEHGIAHFLEHMLFKGTSRRSAKKIGEEIESVGGYINAYTSKEVTAYTINILKDDISLAVDILGDMLSNSLLDPDHINHEKDVILEEIGETADDPWSVVYRKFSEVAWRNQVIGRSVLGTKESILSFTSDKIRAYMSRNYVADRIFIVAVGGVDHNFLVKKVEECFNIKSSSTIVRNLVPSYYVGGTEILSRDLSEVHVMIGFLGCAYQSSDFYSSLILDNILGGGGMSSRLYQEIRERRSLCYSILSTHEAFSDNGIFYVSAATKKENLSELMFSIFEELYRICQSVGEEEISRACAQIRARLIMGGENPSTRAEEIAEQIMFYGNLIQRQKIIEKLSCITCKDITDLASRFFWDKNPTISALGPIETLPLTDHLTKKISSSKTK
ncbi:Mitochondrial processing peptidase-like protein [Liberibacter crescens BT-1]|uniref:Mitochondrial processing peptidase-like protein n=1 Tax=Liberibacter crescens (strain BT-1) TaxID=1215343 RepID=L0ETX7_LIBCB|nr:Mitochondrial processing peptidase-like protein [Liberibacter crescens BT-1]AMC12378.1 peptidase M16 [Liberibacter crescens]